MQEIMREALQDKARAVVCRLLSTCV